MGAWRTRLLVHPWTIASVVLLACNDTWFKVWWPGVVTGKVSDLAGVWIVGALAAAALGSVRWGTALTALGFALLKTVPSVAVLAAPVLGGVTRRDPTDLVALLVLWPLGAVAQRLGAQRAPRANDAWSTVGALFVVSAAVFTTSATSCESTRGVEQVGLTTDGRAVALLGNKWWVFSGDHAVGTVPTATVDEGHPNCLGDTCFTVESSGVDADGLRAFEWTEDQREQIEWRDTDGGCPGVGPGFLDLVTRDTDDGGEVWVAMGEQGVLVRRGDGTWHRLPVETAKPIEFTESAWHQHLWLLPLVLALVMPVVLLGLRHRWGRPSVGVIIAAHACNLALGLWALVTHPSNGLLSSADLPPEFGRKVFWWTIVAQLPWVFAMVRAATELRRRADQS